jgi:anthranilate synthase/aminodeoxychorismate synthase-like glutamine amidotransferase
MILLIDNYDSFTYNLLHYISQLDVSVKVVRNDAITVNEILENAEIKGVVISPGPCTPDESGICLDLIVKAAGRLPILGVCLGHEAIGQAFGGKIVRVDPMHGKVSMISHNGRGIFNNIKNPFNATRYHSLVVERSSLPEDLEITAETNDGLIMAVQHKRYDIYGLQFHPESIASEQGHEILGNFINLTK